MKLVCLGLFALAAYAQETPTEREAARDVIKKMSTWKDRWTCRGVERLLAPIRRAIRWSRGPTS